MASNFVQGAWSASVTLLTNLADQAGAVGPTIDLSATIPYEVSLYVTMTTASAPATLTRGASLYFQYSPDGTNWTTFDPTTVNGLSDMQYIGFIPLQNANPSRKFLSTAGAPTNRWIRPVVWNDTGVSHRQWLAAVVCHHW